MIVEDQLDRAQRRGRANPRNAHEFCPILATAGSNSAALWPGARTMQPGRCWPTVRASSLVKMGASKLAGENAVRSAGGPHLVIRTSWVYAATGANFLRTIARLARERDELSIVSDQIGAPTSAKLIADAVAKIIGSPDPPLIERFRSSRGVVNVAARAKRAGTALLPRSSKASKCVTSPCG